MSNFIKVAILDELGPGQRKLCNVSEKRVAVLNLDGTIYAFDNHCPHRGGPVGAGLISGGIVSCPWHGWRFDVASGSCLQGGEPLRTYPVRLQGADVLIDVDPPVKPTDLGEGIHRYLIRYGALGHVGRFGSVEPVRCRRGDRVVVHTDRGLEVGEVLLSPQDPQTNIDRHAPAGELLRVLTDKDRLDAVHRRDEHLQVLEQCRQIIEQRRISVAVIDAELLLDGQTMILYYVGQPTAQLGPVAVELGESNDRFRVQFQSAERDKPVPAADSSIGDGQTNEIASHAKNDAASADPARVTKQESIKRQSAYLRGTIRDELDDDATTKFSSTARELLKFHGVYQQDDRDARKTSASDNRTGKRHIFMVRTKVPGGRLTAAQMLAELDIADRFGNGTLRITSRQGLQLHGVVKSNLRDTIQHVHDRLLTTFGACGDTARNVMCCPAPLKANRIRRAMQATAADVARHLQPRSAAYFEIWIDDAPLADSPLADPPLEHVEPIYGRTYLPRKFKIGIGLPDDNCVDVYTQDVGLLAIVEGTADQPQVTGYNVIVGGGLGMTPAVASTHPRLGDPMAFVPYGETLRVVNAIVEVQRDFGNRQDRRHARLKYLIERWGVQQFREHVQKYLGDLELDAHRPIEVTACDDHLGWQPQGDGKFFLGLPIDNGRIGDDQSLRRKTGLRRLLQRFHMPVRLTPQQNLLLCDLDAQCRQEVFDLLAEHGMPTPDDISPLHRLALACPALPTCGLAITEAERVMPRLLAELDAELIRLGLDGQNITVRMTGCPNACARPYTADIGIVGKAAGRYTIYVGGGLLGTRLNFVYQEMVPFDEIVSRLRPLLQHYMADRQAGESLGDYCHRQGVKA